MKLITLSLETMMHGLILSMKKAPTYWQRVFKIKPGIMQYVDSVHLFDFHFLKSHFPFTQVIIKSYD